MNHPTKQAKNLKVGDRIICGQGEQAPIGIVDFVYKCHGTANILLTMPGGEAECRSFKKDDLIPLAQ